jgi:hypothetical protein
MTSFSDAQVLERKLFLLVELFFSFNYILRFVYTSVPYFVCDHVNETLDFKTHNFIVTRKETSFCVYNGTPVRSVEQ